MRKNSLGFTLLELMITVGVIGILASIAYPSYRQSVMKSHRADAKVELMQVTQNLEKYFTANGTYSGFTTRATSEHGYYTIALPTLTASTYQVQATATGNQAADTHCALFSITNTNDKTGTTNADCWTR